MASIDKYDRPSIIAACFWLAALGLRIPFVSRYLYSWDSVNFALALERYSLREHQPHPPGYPLYVGLGRLLNALLDDANLSLLVISVVAGAAAVVIVYLVGRSLFGNAAGVIAGLLALFSPLAWYYSEVALTYEAGFMLVAVITWLMHRLFFEKRYAVAAAAAIGLAAGFRQDVLMFLMPVWFIGTLRVGRRAMLASWLALAVAVAAWLLPLFEISGGFRSYRGISSLQFGAGVSSFSVFEGGLSALAANVRWMARAALELLGPAFLALVYLAARLALRWRDMAPERWVLLFLLIMIMPALLFFALYLFDPAGYLLIYSAPLLLLAARGVEHAARDAAGALARAGGWLKERRQTAFFLLAAASLSVTAVIDAAIFREVFLYTRPTLIASLTVSSRSTGIYSADEDIREAVSIVRGYDPSTTVVVVFEQMGVEWRRMMYYLPEFRIVGLNSESGKSYYDARWHVMDTPGETELCLDRRITTILLFGLEPGLAGLGLEPELKQEGHLEFYEADVPDTDTFRIGVYRFVRG